MAEDNVTEPFDSIESAQDFVTLLASTVTDSIRDLDEDRKAALDDGDDRRVQAIDVALYKLRLLDGHVRKSARILNDLRSLRRLLLKERAMEALEESPDPDENVFWS